MATSHKALDTSHKMLNGSILENCMMFETSLDNAVVMTAPPERC
jgi:hypothetical protein